MSQENLKEAIYTALTADTGGSSLYTAVGGRIYDTVGPPKAQLPLLVYNIITDEPFGTLGNDHINATVQFDLYTKLGAGTGAATEINDKLYTLLNRQSFTMTGHTGAHARCDERGTASEDDGEYRITSEYTIRATKT